MKNITITFAGLEGLAAAIDNLAGAIQAQEALVVPEGTKPADPVFTAQTEAKTAKKKPPAAAKATVTAKEVRTKFTELARAGKRDELRDLLAEFGAENVSSLKESDYDEVYARLEAL